MSVQSALDDIARQGFCLVDDFLEPHIAKQLHARAEYAYQNTEFYQARVGHAQSTLHAEHLRRDKIMWLNEPEECSEAEQHYYSAVWEYALACNRQFFLGLKEFECHYAIYEAGDFYRKHRDTFQNNNRRKISSVYYMNPNWLSEHGGELVLYGEDGSTLQRIAPLFNRLVLFDSRIEHEVLPTALARYSITGWLKTAL